MVVAMLWAMGDASSRLSDMRLKDALEAIYSMFATPTPSAIEGCPCCISTRKTDILLTVPLRSLTGLDLWRYVSGAFLTIGNERDFRYLLPRILEVSISDPGNALDPEVVLGKLARANWRAWSHQECRAIEEFVDAWFERELIRDIAEVEAEGPWVFANAERVLCGAACAGLDISRWLVRLSESDANGVIDSLKERFPRHLSPFWEETPVGFAQLSTILTQEQI